MGLSAEQVEAMERRALCKLRQAAKAAGMGIPL